MDREAVFPPEVEAAERPPTDASITSPKEKREVLIDRLETKVATVLGLQHRIEVLADEKDPLVIEQALDDMRTTVKTTMPPEAISKYNEFKSNAKRYQLAQEKGWAMMAEGKVWSEIKHLVRPAQESILAEQDDLLKNEDLQFLNSMEDVLKSLRHKHKELTELRKHPEKTLAILNECFQDRKLGPSDIMRTIETPFETTFVLSETAFSQNGYGDALGMHFRGTPFSIVREQPETEHTIHHERVHNVLDGANDIGKFHDSEKWIAYRQQHQTATEPMRSAIEGQLLRFDPEQLLNQMHDELLAGLSNLELRPTLVDTPSLSAPKGINRKFAAYAIGYSTAGYHASLIAGTYNSIAKRCTSPERQQQLHAFGQEFQARFTRAIEHMKQALERAKSMGPEEQNRLHALLFVLPPSKYRHLDRYLDSSKSEPLE